MMFKRSLCYLCILTLVALLSFSIGGICLANSKETLSIGIQDISVSLDPAESYELSAMGMLNQLYEKLVNFENGDFTQPVPELAESWEIRDNGKTWIFHVRKDVSFSTGNPVNADAVVFSLRRAIKLEHDPSWLLTQFGTTEESITKIGEYTVQIVLDQPYAPTLFLTCLTTVVASILDPEVVMQHELNGDMGSAWLEEHSAGTGPFVLEQRKRDEPVQYMLMANEHYWKTKPAFKQIIVRSIQNPLEQMVLLEQGEIDIAWDLQPAQAKRLKGNPDIQIFESLTLRITYVSMDLSYAPLKKPEVRDAIRYAIDYDGVVNFILQGAAVKIQTIIPRGLLGYNPAMPYNRDLEKAKQLLAEAGYPDGFDVELKCLNFTPWIEVAMKIKSDLAKIGINVKITQMTASQLYDDAITPRKFQMYMWDWLPDFVDPDNNAKVFAHCDSLEDDATVKMMAWEAKDVDQERSKLVEQAARELDHKKREELYQKITASVLDDGAFVLLYTPIKQYGVRSEILGTIASPSIIWSMFPVLE